jgi:sugar phosphate isomerase/epimerase
MKTNRRQFLRDGLLATAGVSAGIVAADAGVSLSRAPRVTRDLTNDDSFKISVFSKHLQWLGYAEMAQVAAGIGFDGIDITVRPGGHVLPERVEDALPEAVESIRKTGLNVYMITTAITDAEDPLTEPILKTASALQIPRYRTGWFRYRDDKSVEDNLRLAEEKLRGLANLNQRYKISGEYQNHSGKYVGAPIWDLHQLLTRINSPHLGSQYDILHATVEGANTWSIGLKLIAPFVRSIDIKDFQWAKNDNKWRAEVVPIGQGMVDYKEYFAQLKAASIRVPISMHFEYPLGGAEHGRDTLSIDGDEVIAAMTRDLNNLKVLMRDAGVQPVTTPR